MISILDVEYASILNQHVVFTTPGLSSSTVIVHVLQPESKSQVRIFHL